MTVQQQHEPNGLALSIPSSSFGCRFDVPRPANTTTDLICLLPLSSGEFTTRYHASEAGDVTLFKIGLDHRATCGWQWRMVYLRYRR